MSLAKYMMMRPVPPLSPWIRCHYDAGTTNRVIEAINISDLSSPFFIGSVNINSDENPNCMVPNGNYVYALCGNNVGSEQGSNLKNAIVVLDFTDPETPAVSQRITGPSTFNSNTTFQTETLRFGCLSVDKNWLFVSGTQFQGGSNYRHVILIYDCSDPSTLVFEQEVIVKATTPYPQSGPVFVAPDNVTLIFPTGYYLFTLDINDPTAAIGVTESVFNSGMKNCIGAALSDDGDYLFVGNTGSTTGLDLSIIDISDRVSIVTDYHHELAANGQSFDVVMTATDMVVLASEYLDPEVRLLDASSSTTSPVAPVEVTPRLANQADNQSFAREIHDGAIVGVTTNSRSWFVRNATTGVIISSWETAGANERYDRGNCILNAKA